MIVRGMQLLKGCSGAAPTHACPFLCSLPAQLPGPEPLEALDTVKPVLDPSALSRQLQTPVDREPSTPPGTPLAC